MNIRKNLRLILSTSFIFILTFHGLPRKLAAGTHKAICSFYTDYHPCRVTISETHIEANLPTDYLYVDESNFTDLKVYEDFGKSSNLVVGTVSTLLLGPLGLLGFLVTKKSGTIDYAVSFENHRGRKKTAFIRFKNMKAAANLGKDLPILLKNIAKE
tara:strand:+ start:99 stop:569 length:471 start_codon:yes stop_codon:yes gene_type:complete